MNSVELEVKKSNIGKSGRSRMCEKAFVDLEIEPGEDIVVSTEENSITVSAFTDDLVEEDCIYLRKGDFEKLEVGENEKVLVSPHSPISEKVKEKIPWPKKEDEDKT